MHSFAAAVFFLIITPGPGVLSAAGVGSGFGYRAGLRYVAGLWLGNLSVGLLVVSGIWAALATVPGLRSVLGAASLIYLFYLAMKIAFAGSRIGFIATDNPPRFLNGLALQGINPKAYAVNVFLFSNFPFMSGQIAAETVAKFLILNAIWIPIHLVWLQAGVTVRRLNLPARRQRAINIGMAASMLIVVALAAWNHG
ncbi:MAG: LysE family translocator [Paracoccaceae bacterium]